MCSPYLSSRLNINSDFLPILLERSSLGAAADAEEAEVSLVDEAFLIAGMNAFDDKLIRFFESIVFVFVFVLKI